MEGYMHLLYSALLYLVSILEVMMWGLIQCLYKLARSAGVCFQSLLTLYQLLRAAEIGLSPVLVLAVKGYYCKRIH